MKTKIQPLFKWTGSKQRMMQQYAPHFFPEQNFTRFVDLFAGGLTNSLWVYENYPDKEFVINDWNGELTLLYATLADDVDGVVHISQLSEEHVTKVKEVVNIGDEVEARVIKVDKAERRIGLSIKAASYSEEELKKETAAFDALRPSSDLVGLEQAFQVAEEWRPSEENEEEEK